MNTEANDFAAEANELVPESNELAHIDDVIAYAKALPDFPNKAVVIQRLETRNLNRYQEAVLNLNDVLAQPEPPLPSIDGRPILREQLEALVDKISRLEANDIVAE